MSTESVGSRRELFANSVHTADADSTVESRRPQRCVGHEIRLFGLGLEIEGVGQLVLELKAILEWCVSL